MQAVYDEVTSTHDPKFFLVKGKMRESTEQPERARRLLTGLERSQIKVRAPTSFDHSYLSSVHDDRYLDFLKHAYQQWQELPDSSAEVIANVHPLRRRLNYPTSIVGRAGWHMADTACPLGEHTWQAACSSANVALTAAQLVLQGKEQLSYALCRPPGHHAYTDMAAGFCFLNNSAIAAQYARSAHERVAILDVDVHHGNGTQDIFYDRADVLTVSIHADPNDFYPFFWGYANETGEGEGEGYNLNLPLEKLSGDPVFLQALGTAIEKIKAFDPGMLVVALGLDASEADPLRGLSVTTEGFNEIGKVIAAAGFPTVFVQEGGYLSDILTDNLAAVLTGAVSGRPEAVKPDSGTADSGTAG